jgi:Flp pilus assembly secretin CpaC
MLDQYIRGARLAWTFLLFCLLLICVYSRMAAAQETGSVIQLGPAQARIVELPRPAGAVIVAAPEALAAVLDSPQRLVLIPRQISATSLTVLDQSGTVMLQSSVIISGRNTNAMRVTRGCTGTGNCLPSSVEFCADDCVTLPILATAVAGSNTGAAPMGAGDTPLASDEPVPSAPQP